jgi:hypothetical protein
VAFAGANWSLIYEEAIVGRPFATELATLDATYRWSLTQPIEELCSAIARTARESLLCIGSGGSLTAAAFAARLHERFAGKLSRFVTPLELRTAVTQLHQIDALFIRVPTGDG